MLSGGDSAPKGVYPAVVSKLLLNRLVFPTYQLKQVWGKVPGGLAIKPVVMPMEIVVEDLKIMRSASLQGNSEPSHGLGSSVHSCHNQQRRRALQNLSRSAIPKSTKSLGLATVSQLTRQCPLFMFSYPFQRKDLLSYQFSS